MNAIVEAAKDNPMIFVGGTLGAVFLLTLMRGGGSAAGGVSPEHTLESQRISGNINVALAGIQAEREKNAIAGQEIMAGRDVALYQGQVQAYLGGQAFNAQVAQAAYSLAATDSATRAAVTIADLQSDTIKSESRNTLSANLAGIVASSNVAKQALTNEARKAEMDFALGSATIDAQKMIAYREQDTLQSLGHHSLSNEYAIGSKTLDNSLTLGMSQLIANQNVAAWTIDSENRKIDSNERLTGLQLHYQQGLDTLQLNNAFFNTQAQRDVAIHGMNVANEIDARDHALATQELLYAPTFLAYEHAGTMAALEYQHYGLMGTLDSERQIAMATLETQQYIAKKMAKTGLLNNIIGTAGNLFGNLMKSAVPTPG